MSNENLIAAGASLANTAYNLAQRAGTMITAHECEVLDTARKAWDEAPRDPVAAAGNSQSQDARVAELEAEVDALRSAAEELAKIWDECEGEDTDDIGAAIRHDFARFVEQEKLIAAMGKQEGGDGA